MIGTASTRQLLIVGSLIAAFPLATWAGKPGHVVPDEALVLLANPSDADSAEGIDAGSNLAAVSGVRSNDPIVAVIGLPEGEVSPLGYCLVGLDEESPGGVSIDELVALRLYRWSLNNQLKTRVADIPMSLVEPCANCGGLSSEKCVLFIDRTIAEAGYATGDLVYYQVIAATDCGGNSEVIWTQPEVAPAVYLPTLSITLPGCAAASFPYPQASIQPGTLTAAAGASAKGALHLANLGGAPYAWSLSASAAWIVPDATSGEVGASSSSDIGLTLSAASLSASLTPYTGNLFVDGPGCSGFTVPVSFLVTEPLPTPTPSPTETPSIADRWMID